MAQTTKTANVYFPKGAVVAAKALGEATYTDVGAINSAVTATLNWTENQVETANAGNLQKQIKEMVIEGGFTLINLEPEGVTRMGGGMFTQVDTDGVPTTDIPDQDIAAGWTDNTIYPLIMQTSSSDSTKLRTTAQPTITTVTADPDGTPEVLTENTDYVIMEYPGAESGWGIQFMSANFSTASEGDLVTIDYGSNTPVASTTIYAGSSTLTLSAYALQITSTDSNGKIRRLELFSVDGNAGGFQFNFKGANEDGVEEMPLTYTARIDTSLTDGRQLFAWTIESGAA